MVGRGDKVMEFREYMAADCDEIAEMFYNTVHTVNARNYSKNQLYAWATGCVDKLAWDRKFTDNYTLVAVEDGLIVGFGNIDGTGVLDMLYVHRDYQGKGIATAICDRLEGYFTGKRILSYVSVTARTFFEKRGYKAIEEQLVVRGNEKLRNYIMVKDMQKKHEHEQKLHM